MKSKEGTKEIMAQAGVNPHTAADLLRQAMAHKYVIFSSSFASHKGNIVVVPNLQSLLRLDEMVGSTPSHFMQALS